AQNGGTEEVEEPGQHGPLRTGERRFGTGDVDHGVGHGATLTEPSRHADRRPTTRWEARGSTRRRRCPPWSAARTTPSPCTRSVPRRPIARSGRRPVRTRRCPASWPLPTPPARTTDRKSTRLNSSHVKI